MIKQIKNIDLPFSEIWDLVICIWDIVLRVMRIWDIIIRVMLTKETNTNTKHFVKKYEFTTPNMSFSISKCGSMKYFEYVNPIYITVSLRELKHAKGTSGGG